MLTAALDRLALLPGNPEVSSPTAARGTRPSRRRAATRSGRESSRQATTRRDGKRPRLNVRPRPPRGEVLLFLHADTRLPLSSTATVAAALPTRGRRRELRASLRGAIVSRRPDAALQLLRRAGIYYGDSAIFVRADLFARLGGFRDFRSSTTSTSCGGSSGPGRTVCLPGPAVTSARRWRANGAAARWPPGCRTRPLPARCSCSRLVSLYRRAR